MEMLVGMVGGGFSVVRLVGVILKCCISFVVLCFSWMIVCCVLFNFGNGVVVVVVIVVVGIIIVGNGGGCVVDVIGLVGIVLVVMVVVFVWL